MSAIEKLKQLMLIYQNSLNPDKVPLQKHKAALRDFSESLIEIAPALLAVAEASELMRSLQKRGARDPNELAMIAAAADRLDRAIAKLEGGKS